MKRGFSLIELLVASLLLGILVSILTMLFNTSAVAWRTGVAGVAEMNDIRRKIGTERSIADSVLPGLGDSSSTASAGGDTREIRYRTISLWRTDADQLRSGGITASRAFGEINWDKAPQFTIQNAMKGDSLPLSNESEGGAAGSSLFTVGVRSAGPNGVFGDDDDITSWPEGVL